MGLSNLSSGFRPGVCTSTTRPSAPFEGQMIYETDTNQLLVYDGSAWGNIVSQQTTFTNESARDSALPNPTEGMMAYLTSPTIPSSTVGTGGVPSGILTIYNGSVWVCRTPIAAYNDSTGTTTSASYTASLSGSPGTNPAVTLVTGTTAKVTLSSSLATNASTGYAIMGVAVSGATTIAAASNRSVLAYGLGNVAYSYTFVMSGLTAGTNTFTLNYAIDVTGTATFYSRHLIVEGVA